MQVFPGYMVIKHEVSSLVVGLHDGPCRDGEGYVEMPYQRVVNADVLLRRLDWIVTREIFCVRSINSGASSYKECRRDRLM